jgi:NAD(P)-dependent dehydrogenase (short-subunit alcohol dehydrogenase family)
MDNARKLAIITGATSGLGEAATLALAREGFDLIAVGRDAARGASVVERARALGAKVEFVSADLFSRADTDRLAALLREKAPKIDVLINNAGAMFARRDRTADGVEATVALNLQAPWRLTEGLLEPLSAAKGRVINIVTGLQNFMKASPEQLFGANVETSNGQYMRSKLALMAVTLEQQRRYHDRGITFVALHPGIILETRFNAEMPALMKKLGPFIVRLLGLASTPEQAAARYVALATGALEPGGFYYEGKLRPAPRFAANAAFAASVWDALASAAPALSAGTGGATRASGATP